MKKQLYTLFIKLLSHLKVFTKNKPFLTTILLFVFGLHLFSILYSQMHSIPPLNPNRRKLIVKTMTLPPDQSKTIPVTKNTQEKILPVKGSLPTAETVKPKKTTPTAKKKLPTPTATSSKKLSDKTITANDSKTKKLLSDLQESIAKIEINRDNSLPAKMITIPRPISELKADAYEIQSDSMEEDGVLYRDILINYLKDTLHLPGYGTVKVKLTLEHQGTVQNIVIASSDSEVNRLYLEKILQELAFPPFIGELASKKSYMFSLTFCSDQ